MTWCALKSRSQKAWLWNSMDNRYSFWGYFKLYVVQEDFVPYIKSVPKVNVKIIVIN